jgi:hypothetical protein
MRVFGTAALADPDQIASAIQASGVRLSARIAFGVRNAPRAGQTSWIPVELDVRTVLCDSVVVLSSHEAPEAELDVVLGISATDDVWRSAGEDAGFLNAVQSQSFFVSGEAPFFIRHLEMLLAIWTSLARR